MLYWARWTCDRDSASEAMRTPSARDRFNSQSASFNLPNLPRPIGEQVVNSGHKAYGTATAVCHTGKTLTEWRLRGQPVGSHPMTTLRPLYRPSSCDITITGRLSGNEKACRQYVRHRPLLVTVCVYNYAGRAVGQQGPEGEQNVAPCNLNVEVSPSDRLP
ncbi:hypothetical protein T4E_10500 [Trichinella pseudospiralis]|uniref:Uncharacterized protein n=1 Tax=Trichinella pseudospiralis TaxID=6337 RepID=A0A0V1FIX6_TRIPS|nr:hypothetical protein T4E_10500 [Trichinella pseudospiralis]KRY85906.1 hypothetical protein T4D_13772 [Trichinella pseudospiralis]